MSAIIPREENHCNRVDDKDPGSEESPENLTIEGKNKARNSDYRNNNGLSCVCRFAFYEDITFVGFFYGILFALFFGQTELKNDVYQTENRKNNPCRNTKRAKKIFFRGGVYEGKNKQNNTENEHYSISDYNR